MSSYLGAIDQGTTGTRFIIFDKTGRIISAAHKEHAQICPRPGWVEHDPEEIWNCTLLTIREAMQKANLQPANLAAVGIANQRETTILWNRKTGRPLCNAIVWQDTRVEDAVAEFSREGGQDRFRAATGLPLATYFSALKIRWILQNVSGAKKLAESGDALFGNLDAYLAWKLTGGPNGGIHVTDVTNAGRTQLMNLATLAWDADLLAAFGVRENILPAIRSSSEVFAPITINELKDVSIAGILGDQQAALVGQTCFAPGQVKCTYGTGCFLLMNAGTRPPTSTHGLLTTPAYKFGSAPAHYALEGSIAIAGALVQWLRDQLGVIQNSCDIEALARTVDDNGGAYFVPAFSGLYAPYWKSTARGVIAGLTRFVNKGHLARAVLEATAFQVRDVLEAMEKDSNLRLDSLRADGGMVENDLLMQFQSDMLNLPVVRPSAYSATTALGAACAAGLAVGYFKDVNDLRANWAVDRTWDPAMAEETRQEKYRLWKRAVSKSFDWTD